MAQQAAPVSSVPEALQAPPAQVLELVLTGRGVQIYQCQAMASDPTKFEWAFKAPEADLFDPQGKKVGRHYAGPTWELADGGKVTARLKAKTDAPGGNSIPFLLLETTGSSGGGFMGKVKSIQRLDTAGGKAPAEKPDKTKLGQEIRVDYSATYKFYVDKP